jgi:energy-coupling factor transporter transmembrane protein EcfT
MEATTFLKSSARNKTVQPFYFNAIKNWYHDLISELEKFYFGMIVFTIMVGSMMGSIAAMYISQSGAPIWQMSLCIAAAMCNNVMAIGQAPTKWVFNVFVFTTLLQVVLIIVNWKL